MFKIIIIIFLICVVVFFIKHKIHIKFKSFFKKGIKLQKGAYGVYCYCGKQGSSKTMSVIKFLHEHSQNNEKIYCNLKSIDNECIPYTYINGLDELLELRKEHDCIIFFDEIFTEITKHQRIGKDVMDFLSQMRKRRIILLTTCQEWRLLPLDFRLYVRYQVNCSMKQLPIINAISIKKIIDGDNIKWSDEEQDFVGQLIETTIWHCEKEICNMYDTYEQIGKFSTYSTIPTSPILSISNNSDVFALNGEKTSEELKPIFDTDFWEDLNIEEDTNEEES